MSDSTIRIRVGQLSSGGTRMNIPGEGWVQNRGPFLELGVCSGLFDVKLFDGIRDP